MGEKKQECKEKREKISKNRMFKEFQDVFPKDVPHELSSLKGTEHHMDLTLGVTLPNREAYKTNLREAKEIQK
ncbi:hypothetical protein CR513_46586, partial [Mucuna pruriens]